MFNFLPSFFHIIQIESVLHSILQELKLLYANHAPQLKPKQKPGSCICSKHTVTKATATNSPCDHQCIKSSRKESESVDPVEDMFNILEGSALIPFMEVSCTAFRSTVDSL